MTKVADLWEQIFRDHDILNRVDGEGKFSISAQQINQYKEARLMTKFDHKDNLPKVFAENNLAILPDSRGTYLIGKFDNYFAINEDVSVPIKKVDFPEDIQTISFQNLYSE